MSDPLPRLVAALSDRYRIECVREGAWPRGRAEDTL